MVCVLVEVEEAPEQANGICDASKSNKSPVSRFVCLEGQMSRRGVREGPRGLLRLLPAPFLIHTPVRLTPILSRPQKQT